MSEPRECEIARRAWHSSEETIRIHRELQEALKEFLADKGCDPITPPDPPEVPPPAA